MEFCCSESGIEQIAGSSGGFYRISVASVLLDGSGTFVASGSVLADCAWSRESELLYSREFWCG